MEGPLGNNLRVVRAELSTRARRIEVEEAEEEEEGLGEKLERTPYDNTSLLLFLLNRFNK